MRNGMNGLNVMVRDESVDVREVLLAQVNRQLQLISAMQHDLARRRAVLEEQATRLRLGVSPFVVRATLEQLRALDENFS